MEKLLLRPTEAADALGVSRSKLYELLAEGAVPAIRLGGSVRVPADALREWVRSRVPDTRLESDEAPAARGTVRP